MGTSTSKEVRHFRPAAAHGETAFSPCSLNLGRLMALMTQPKSSHIEKRKANFPEQKPEVLV